MQTLKADSQRRVRIPHANPGQVFAYENLGNGQFMLTLIKPVKSVKDRPAKVRFEKRGGYTVGVTDRTVDEQTIKKLLADSP